MTRLYQNQITDRPDSNYSGLLEETVTLSHLANAGDGSGRSTVSSSGYGNDYPTYKLDRHDGLRMLWGVVRDVF